MEQQLIAHEPPQTLAPPPFPDRQAAIAYHMEALEELADPASRPDGWTPFARKLFLQTLAETGRVTLACNYAQLSKQSAYALRARDRIFAAGWDAACELARIPLADALYEQALDGLTETITRPDGQTLTRHRFDSRLSIAVLNRLDRRCDRAAEQGSGHVGAVGQWNEFTSAVGKDDREAAEAILERPVPSDVEGAKVSQPSQLREETDEPHTFDERVWMDEERGQWRTDFPAPEGFDGDEDQGAYCYSRTLTATELILVEQRCETEEREERAADEAERDAWFAALRAGAAEQDEEGCVRVPAEAGTQSAAASSADGAGLGSCLRRSTSGEIQFDDQAAEAPDLIRG